jgi:hypothetical protein
MRFEKDQYTELVDSVGCDRKESQLISVLNLFGELGDLATIEDKEKRKIMKENDSY